MFKKSSGRIIGNIPLFIISMVISIVLWVVVINYQDPTITYTKTGIVPEITGLNALRNSGYIAVPPQELSQNSVKLSGKRDALINSMMDIGVEYNLANVSSLGDVSIKPSVVGVTDLRVVKNNFPILVFKIEKLATKDEIPVIVRLKRNVADTNGVTLRPESLVKSITVTGTSANVEKVAYCICEVDAGELSSGARVDAEYYFVDKDDNKIEDAPDLSSITQKIPLICVQYREVKSKIKVLTLPELLTDNYDVEIIEPEQDQEVFIAYKEGVEPPSSVEAVVQLNNSFEIDGEGEYELPIKLTLNDGCYSTEDLTAIIKVKNKEIEQ